MPAIRTDVRWRRERQTIEFSVMTEKSGYLTTLSTQLFLRPRSPLLGLGFSHDATVRWQMVAFKSITAYVRTLVQVLVWIYWLCEWETLAHTADLSAAQPHEEHIYFLWVSKKHGAWLFTI